MALKIYVLKILHLPIRHTTIIFYAIMEKFLIIKYDKQNI